jgi:hypothetical protein
LVVALILFLAYFAGVLFFLLAWAAAIFFKGRALEGLFYRVASLSDKMEELSSLDRVEGSALPPADKLF